MLDRAPPPFWIVLEQHVFITTKTCGPNSVDQGLWQDMEPDWNVLHEEQHQGNFNFQYDHQVSPGVTNRYHVNFDQMIQHNESSGTTRNIRRIIHTTHLKNGSWVTVRLGLAWLDLPKPLNTKITEIRSSRHDVITNVRIHKISTSWNLRSPNPEIP